MRQGEKQVMELNWPQTGLRSVRFHTYNPH